MSLRSFRMDIVPDRPLPLFGHRLRTEPGVPGPTSNLEINGLLLQGLDSDPVLLLSIDSLYVGRPLRESVERALAGAISADRILMAASHTHSAPALDPSKPALGEADSEYVTRTADRLRRRLESLLASPAQDVTSMATSTSQVEAGINRRRTAIRLDARHLPQRYIRMAPNRRGPVDRTATVSLLKGDSGRVMAVLWHFACHPTGYSLDAYDADFPGVVRAALRQQFADPDLPVLFLQGCSGDVRPDIQQPAAASLKGRVRALAAGPSFRTDQSAFEAWSARLAAAICRTAAAADRSTPDTTSHRLRAARAVHPGELFYEGVQTPMTFQGIEIGSICIIGGSGEFVTRYASVPRDPRSLVVGCLDDVLGYVPTEAMLAQGGYEADSFCQYFDIPAVAQTVEAATTTALREVERLLANGASA